MITEAIAEILGPKVKASLLGIFGLITIQLLLTIIAVTPALAVTAPTISPGSGCYAMGQGPTVSITAPAGQIYYTLDGTPPSSTNGTLYSSSFSVNETTQINAVALSSGTYSSVTTVAIAIDSNYTSIIYPPLVPYFWYRGDVSIVSTAGNVTGLIDMSGYNHNATASSPNQPTILSSYLNGLSVLNFNPATNGQYLTLPTISSLSSNFSAFVVVQASPVSGAQILSLGDGSNLNNAISMSENSSFQPTFSVYSSAGVPTSVSSSVATTSGQFQLFEIDQAGTSAQISINGIPTGTNASMNAVSSTSLSNNYIGQLTTGGSYFKGQIAELIVYNFGTSTKLRKCVQAYLMQKYQLPQQTLTAPVFNVPTSSLTGPTQVAIWGPDGSTTVYTTDGTTPSASSPVYKAPLLVPYTTTLKAMSINGNLQSAVTSATYTLDSTKFPAPSSGGPTLQIITPLPSTAIP